jgi:isopentenyldiphosphate isomerase
MEQVEYFPLVDDDGKTIGKATRAECHSGSFLLHPVVHLHVFNADGELFLQQRAMNKDIQPGRWDTSVGGHVDYGETIAVALHREAAEELGINHFNPIFIARYKFVSDREAELVHSYYCVYEGPIQLLLTEISAGRFWKVNEIEDLMGKDVFTPNFEFEYNKYIKLLKINNI